VYHTCKCSKFIHNCTCIPHPLHQSKLSLTYTGKVNIKLQFCSLDSITNNKFDSTDKCTCLLQSIYISCKVHGALPIARRGFFFNTHVRSSSIGVWSIKPDRQWQTRSLWTGPCGSKARPVSPNMWDLRCYTATTFQDNLSIPASRGKKSKRQNKA